MDNPLDEELDRTTPRVIAVVLVSLGLMIVSAVVGYICAYNENVRGALIFMVMAFSMFLPMSIARARFNRLANLHARFEPAGGLR